ncbi:hypothetical protein [Luteibacter sp. SG786]|uniref:GTP pyrophosphokinase n=1 Tax=Luteibacter sp. SG786 TaxID=2587130 RepID=UPI001423FA3C|nr:hypothetical protein [Luteibacter sp. SG786]NII55822.1 ppGpp synthetase/RelA/SpoT-type nucleotidyltransferase [Luteibacter sp. SG786]
MGTPIEGRVKTLTSIIEKRGRKDTDLESVTDFRDLIGTRITLLFHRDIATVDRLVQETFDLIERIDKAEELESSQFGYQSLHFVLKVKENWLSSVPSFKGLEGYVFELQLRTLAQHIWAVASHKLQYKREASVPSHLRRSINRVSALLEMVDLEFDRVLSEREQYISEPSDEDSHLNVDLLASVLDLLLPEQNKDEDSEPYDELLAELAAVGIDTVGKLTDLLTETRVSREAHEAKRAVEDPMDDPDSSWERTLSRHRRGVFFTHAGLVRISLDEKYGNDGMRALRWKARRQAS